MGVTTQAGPYPQTLSETGVINLGLGQPSPSLLPLQAVAQAAISRLSSETDPLLLQYGIAPGYAGFREALADFLTHRYRSVIHPDGLFVSSGISSALGWVSQTLASPGQTIVCEDPSYFLAYKIFQDAGLTIQSIPVDQNGLSIDLLEDALLRGLRPAFLYCMPSFHNPTTVTMSSERAYRLVALAEQYDFFIVADEPYVLLHFEEHPPPSMSSYDAGRGRVVALGSFSKILGPGLRLGWAYAERAVLERLGRHGVLRSGGGFNPLVSAIVHETITHGFLERHVQGLRAELKRRCQRLTTAIEKHMPSTCFDSPRGGYFVWLACGDGRDMEGRLEQAQTQFGVSYTPGARCSNVGSCSSHVRLSFSFYTPDELELGVERLARCQATPLAPHRGGTL